MANKIHPEWAMIGWQDGGWHWLLASQELESAQLDWLARTYHFESWEAFQRPGAFRPAWHIDIVGTGRFVLIRGATYAECLADLLFKHGWRADQAELAELPTHDPIRGHLAATHASHQNALTAAPPGPHQPNAPHQQHGPQPTPDPPTGHTEGDKP